MFKVWYGIQKYIKHFALLIFCLFGNWKMSFYAFVRRGKLILIYILCCIGFLFFKFIYKMSHTLFVLIAALFYCHSVLYLSYCNYHNIHSPCVWGNQLWLNPFLLLIFLYNITKKRYSEPRSGDFLFVFFHYPNIYPKQLFFISNYLLYIPNTVQVCSWNLNHFNLLSWKQTLFDRGGILNIVINLVIKQF